jgi:hypothetical protein
MVLANASVKKYRKTLEISLISNKSRLLVQYFKTNTY